MGKQTIVISQLASLVDKELIRELMAIGITKEVFQLAKKEKCIYYINGAWRFRNILIMKTEQLVTIKSFN